MALRLIFFVGWFVGAYVVARLAALAFAGRPPDVAWFIAGLVAMRVYYAACEIFDEFEVALYQTSEEHFRPWFRPIWRALVLLGLTRAKRPNVVPPSLDVPNVDDASVPPIRELSAEELEWLSARAKACGVPVPANDGGARERQPRSDAAT